MLDDNMSRPASGLHTRSELSKKGSFEGEGKASPEITPLETDKAGK